MQSASINDCNPQGLTHQSKIKNKNTVIKNLHL